MTGYVAVCRWQAFRNDRVERRGGFGRTKSDIKPCFIEEKFEMYEKPLSLIVPCHNALSFLAECWDSIKDQSFGLDRMQCIFVDDASTDETYSALKTIQSEYPDSVEVIHLKENLRQGGARNVGLSLAMGTYVQFLDQDDRLLPTACEELYLLAEDYQTDLIQFAYAHPGDKEAHDAYCSEDGFYIVHSVPERKQLLMSGLFYCTHHNLFYRNSLIKQVGSRFPEHRVYEEPLFVYPLYFYAKRLMILSKGLYLGRAHEESSTNTLLPSRLIDHPVVQFALHDFLEQKGLTRDYSDEIAFYILWTAFGETIVNASRDSRFFTCQDFLLLQKECQRRFPSWQENPYFQDIAPEIQKVLGGLTASIDSPDELSGFLSEIAGLSF